MHLHKKSCSQNRYINEIIKEEEISQENMKNVEINLLNMLIAALICNDSYKTNELVLKSLLEIATKKNVRNDIIDLINSYLS